MLFWEHNCFSSICILFFLKQLVYNDISECSNDKLTWFFCFVFGSHYKNPTLFFFFVSVIKIENRKVQLTNEMNLTGAFKKSFEKALYGLKMIMAKVVDENLDRYLDIF